MTRPVPGRLHVRGLGLGAALLLVVFLLVGAPAAAWAHNSLVGTSPEDGATVATPPSTVVLTFNEPAIPTGTRVLVTGPDGSATEGEPRLVDTTVRQDLSEALPAGEYTVEWRVTSADGHPINGAFTFKVRTGTAADETPTAEEPSPTVTAPEQVPDDSGSASAWPWVLGGVAVVAAVVLGWRFSRR